MDLIQALEDRWITGAFNDLAREVSTNAAIIDELFELTLNPEHKIAWRAAYIVDMVHDLAPQMVSPYLPQIIARLPKLTDQSVKRHYTRILSQHNLKELADGALVDNCIKWLLQEETPIAVKAHLMQILHKLSDSFPDFIPELKIVLQEVIPNGSKGVKNRARKILAELNKSN